MKFNLTIQDITHYLSSINAKMVQVEELKKIQNLQMKVVSFAKYTELHEFCKNNKIEFYVRPTASVQCNETVFNLIYV